MGGQYFAAPQGVKAQAARLRNRPWTPRDDEAYARMARANIDIERGMDSITAYSNALRGISASGGSPMMGISEGDTRPGDDFEMVGRAAQREMEDYLRKKRMEELEIEARRMKLQEMQEERAARKRGQ